MSEFAADGMTGTYSSQGKPLSDVQASRLTDKGAVAVPGAPHWPQFRPRNAEAWDPWAPPPAAAKVSVPGPAMAPGPPPDPAPVAQEALLVEPGDDSSEHSSGRR
ncbi:hypothetical protein ACODT5_16435 [Streptomyces sp. 5.8]|uniref:hypothetical protein n=1 Tax=Streptomyces sp. 5.8 TaxID=3406571 RepID=UPI003BB559A5